MKKFLVIVALVSIFATSMFAAETLPAQQKDESKWSSLSYINVPVLKVMEAKNGYVVIYQKNKYGVGNVTIPKSWTEGNKENPRKLKFRKVTKSNECYMTICQKDGQFFRVVLTLPMNKQNPIWGVVKGRNTLDDVDKDTLEIEL